MHGIDHVDVHGHQFRRVLMHALRIGAGVAVLERQVASDSQSLSGELVDEGTPLGRLRIQRLDAEHTDQMQCTLRFNQARRGQRSRDTQT